MSTPSQGQDDSREARAARLVVACPLAVATVLAAALCVVRFQVGLVLLAVSCALLAAFAQRAASGRRSVLTVLLVPATFTALVVVPEMILRLAGFHYGARIQFAYPDPDQLFEFEPDAELFWKLPRARPDVNEIGFIGPEIAPRAPDGVRRILFLGDSCTQQGHPARVGELLGMATKDSIECVNLAMAGYTSYQGRVLTSSVARHLAPEVAVLCFGWNDHWLAFGRIDSERRIRVGLEKLYRASRLLQLVRKLLVTIAGRRADVPGTLRVPIGQYGENLRAMVAAFRDAGAQVLLVTAPTSMYVRGVPDYLIEARFARDEESVLRLHSQYNDTLRAVAHDENVWLLDLEAELSVPAAARCFHDDGIHFMPRGREEVASRIAALLWQRWLMAERQPRPDVAVSAEP